MNIHAASNLDIEKFRKVYALVTGGATEGERSAAKARAGKIAERAGMSLLDAVSKLDAPKPTSKPASNPFDDLFNSPEMRAQRAERQRKDGVKRERVLREYGSVKAVFDPTPWEFALRKAIEPFSILIPYACVSGVQRHYTASMDGELAGDFIKGTPRVKSAISSAFPMPTTIRAAMDEIKSWNRLRWDRSLFFDTHEPEAEVSVRTRLVEEFVAREPVHSWDDMEARFAWKKYEFESEYIDPVERKDPFMDRIEDDFAILRGLYEKRDIETPHVHTGHRTNADKRAAVLSMLDAQPELSDREISRRVGVSPQTVGNWRRRTAAA
ncbi:helix-turn-helix domain-containing protein [Brucella intermedia GD04153]|uniref:Helix-turn-helix domain-containing protein n=1 Tax=Brucella intermedia GD04153 TaxID=2975438 RepID=A0AA42H0K7_9HYPH|nr:helix-turn-helix domain-containing protein [Brucella intermedia]MDH0125780.1 helix-turn-helix domain-containing protein [Brucella intermedia GD04153]